MTVWESIALHTTRQIPNYMGPETAAATFMTDILEATVPGYVRLNSCDATLNSRFET
jgi:hypothetical protein